VRAHAGTWIDQVDRVPPADLIEQLLPATAYAYELRGGRRLQAWENLKKMRGLVRRIQNRGYATLARIADHIESLTAGDESNAVIEALDAVNLMTVHASKGLEFPVVFVVNLAKGATGPARPIRVVMDGEGGEPSVSVGPFVSETDEAEREREKQETRRLMYVALTRARDRLYLSSALKDGELQAGRGSLAEVLPDSMKPLFARAATASDPSGVIAWASKSGRRFEWRLCAIPEAPVDPVVPADNAASALAAAVDRFDPVVDHSEIRRLPVTEWLRDSAGPEPLHAAGSAQDLIVGTLVHRLFQFADMPHADDEAGDMAHARTLLAADERAAIEDVDATVTAAVDAWRSMRTRPDVSKLLASGQRLHEVPFSLLRATGPAGDRSIVLRGTIDCLIRRPDGSIVVVEIKTGKPRGWHRRGR
jgi:ATP-dependent exoDNAse (exonuclease V) beta subunit